MKTLGQSSWKQLILSWLLVERHCPSLIKIVSAHEPPATFRAVLSDVSRGLNLSSLEKELLGPPRALLALVHHSGQMATQGLQACTGSC